MRFPNYKKQDTIDKAKKIFLQEVNQRLPEAIECMTYFKTNGYSEEIYKKLYKFAHTIKGSGQMVGLLDISEPAAEMAVALLLINKYEVKLEKGIINFLEERMEEIIYEAQNLKDNSEVLAPLIQVFNKNKKIFVVDDDTTVTSIVKRALILKGYDVNIYHDIIKAEEDLQIEKPDLIVLDIIMSTVEDGIKFCRKIRKSGTYELMPIIFLSKKSDLRDKLEGFATGADDYLCKPFEVDELIARIQALLNRLETHQHLILQDDLTKVYNRRYLEQRLKEEIAKVDTTGGYFSVAMIDLDHFKSINDQYGHVVGDEVLQVLVKRMSGNLRTEDVICRYGGEEFIIIFPNTLKEDAYKVVERLRKSLANDSIKVEKSMIELNVTISGGVSSYPEDGITIDSFIKSADLAMYQAKSNGRNKIFLC